MLKIRVNVSSHALSPSKNVSLIEEELTIHYFAVANGCRERRRS